jgi:ABC-type uncharacterized transport system fused permease/ATPase subunit
LKLSVTAIPIEMYISIMAGFVIAFFLMVGEIVVLRKQAAKVLAHLQLLYITGRKIRFVVVMCGIVVCFLIQPVIVAVLVALALNNLNPHFSVYLLQEIKQVLSVILTTGRMRISTT